MNAKKLDSDSNQPGSDQKETERPRVLAVHTFGRGFLDGPGREAFSKTSAFKTAHSVSSSLPSDVIVEDAGDEMP
jgi:hypothetical protein